MSLDLDARGRKAAEGLKAAVSATPVPPLLGVAPRSISKPAAALRPAWLAAALVFVSAVGLAMVVDPQETASTTSTTTAPTTTTLTTTPPTTAPSVVPAPAVSTTTSPPPDTTPPPLSIDSPADGAEFEEKAIEFSGTTEPGAVVMSGPYEAEVDDDGRWSIVLVLSEGGNTAKFTARDEAGNQSQASVTVYYRVDNTSTTTTKVEKEVAGFEANAKFGSCAEPEPFDVYYGKGEPGSNVFVQSEHGNGSVKVNGEGEWELTVFFQEMEPGQTIQVKVFDDYGRKKTFGFTFNP